MITVTTVYPGNAKTPIHRDSIEFGLRITSPAERLEDVAGTLVRAALDDPAVRDITTTRTAELTNALSRFAPRRGVDGIIMRGDAQAGEGPQLRRHVDHARPVRAQGDQWERGALALASHRDEIQPRSGEGIEPSKRRVATPCRF